MKKKQFGLIFLVGIFFLSMSSCFKNMSKKKVISEDEYIVYPSSPETARFQYLTSIKSSEDLVAKRSKFVEYILGKKEVTHISKPYTARLNKGKLYVCDQGAGFIEVFDLKKKAFTVFAPTGEGQLMSPINCAFDENDFLYVADVRRNAVLIYNQEGKYINSISDTVNFRPVDVFVYNKKVYVVNFKGAKISVYDTDSANTFLYDFLDESIKEENKLIQPINVFVNDQYVYVCDALAFKVKKYNHDGKFDSAIGGLGSNFGNFGRPKGIAVDRDSNLFALDASFENVQIFDKNNQLLMFFGEHTTALGGFWMPTTITIDYDNLEYFQKYLNPSFKLKYLVLIANQYGPSKINIYGAVEPIK